MARAPVGRRPFADRPAARGVAALVLAGCIGLLAYLHRDDLWPPEADEVANRDPAAGCIAERHGEIAQMLADGLIQAEQAELFRNRAEAMCRAQVEGGSSGPGLPGLPPQ